MSLAQIKAAFLQDVGDFLQSATLQNLVTPGQSAQIIDSISPLTAPSSTLAAAIAPYVPGAGGLSPYLQACTPPKVTPNTAIPNDPTASPYNPIASLFALQDLNSPATSTFMTAYSVVAGMPVLFFDLVAQGQSQSLSKVSVTIAPPAGAAQGPAVIKNVYLYDGQGTYIASSLLSSAGVATFSNLSYALPTRTLKEFVVAVSVGAIGTAPTTFQASNLTFSAGTPEQACAGLSATTQTPVTSLSNNVVGSPITFYTGGPQFTLSAPAVTSSHIGPVFPAGLIPGVSATSTGSTALTATFTMGVKAIGNVLFGAQKSSYPAFGTSTGYVWVYKNGVPDFSNSTNSQYKISMSNVRVSGMATTSDGTGYILPDKSSGQLQVTYSITYPASSLTTYSLALEGINWQGFTGPLAVGSTSVAQSVPGGYLAGLNEDNTSGDGTVAGSSPGYTALQSDLSSDNGGSGNIDPELGGSGATSGDDPGDGKGGNLDPELGAGSSQDQAPTTPPIPELYSPTGGITPHLSANPVLAPLPKLKFNPASFIDFPRPACDSLGCANLVG